MTTNNPLDVTRLLGFATIGDRLAKGVDFKDNMLGARLGAKVGFDEFQRQSYGFFKTLGILVAWRSEDR